MELEKDGYCKEDDGVEDKGDGDDDNEKDV